MNAVELIIAKRNGRELTSDELTFLVHGTTAGRVPDYQFAAFLMAVFFKGMTPKETAAYTRAMIDSGDRLTFDPAPLGFARTDKHSTGGVGDKISLPLTAVVAAAGVPVPMMSGRGLGHTGGTLDKLESIPGYRVQLDPAAARRQLQRVGAFIIGQSEHIAPADKRIYALRDVTGTVESIPLICGSILSKKVAAGVQALVMDVKTGSGAFMPTVEAARNLAQQLVAIGTELGLTMLARITRMDRPLGRQIGNALEVLESIDVLRNSDAPEIRDVRELTLTFASDMLVLAGAAADDTAGRIRAEDLIRRGTALEKFREWIAAQGGDPAVVDNPERLLPLAPTVTEFAADRTGVVAEFDTREIGLACNALGAGRQRVEDSIDPGVGLTVERSIGASVRSGEPLFLIRHRAGRGLDECVARLRRAVRIADAMPPGGLPLIIERIAPDSRR